MNPLTNIPPKIRLILYWCGYMVGVVGQGTTIVWGAIAAASPAVTMPLGLVIASAVLGLLQTQLNLLSGSNVPSYQDVVDGDVPPPDEHVVGDPVIYTSPALSAQGYEPARGDGT